MNLNGIAAVVGVVVGIVVLIPLLMGAVFVVVVVATRAEPDPSGRRPRAVYAFATAFVTVLTVIFASTGLVASLAQLIGKHSSSAGEPMFRPLSSGAAIHPIGDAVARGSVLSIIVLLIAGAIYRQHRSTGDDLSAGATAVDPVGRVRASYIAAVAFVCIALTVIATVVVCYDVFRFIAPGVFAPGLHGSRVQIFRSFLPALWLAVFAARVRGQHLNAAPAAIALE